jgi:hypothetical protein
MAYISAPEERPVAFHDVIEGKETYALRAQNLKKTKYMKILGLERCRVARVQKPGDIKK